MSRGRTHLDKLAKQRIQGVRKDVAFNKLGQPIGEAAIAMQSYIGVLAREKVQISYKTWKYVPSDVKELIWESVNLMYNVDLKWKNGCLKSANNKWRQYKSYLTKTFILSKLDKPEKLDEPPIGYGITRDTWRSFVISRTSEDFMEQTTFGTAYSTPESKTEYTGDWLVAASCWQLVIHLVPHALKLFPDFPFHLMIVPLRDVLLQLALILITILIVLVLQFDDQFLRDGYIQQKREGKLIIEGTKEDILTKALDTEEYNGRVRGIGGHITPTIYFNSGRRWKHADVITELKRELMEARKKILEQDARIQNLEVMVYKKGTMCDLIDDKGSCSVKLQPMIEDDMKKDDDDLQILCQDDVLQV
ncbi:uncharacterized protein LOC122039416 [Zingiber officinale]|uniref:uncharacterized protein LOC122039416 n=1 Tax=Zingiber officinale TaxID=94328 RepID=UPI001C4D50A7|nr:uncharacterized protein LOC122039416 [Zingiber officinale]